VDAAAVAVIEVDAVEVKLVAGLAACAPAEAEGVVRWMTDEPVGDIEVVDVLLNDVVARHLCKAHPIAYEVVGVALVRIFPLVPECATTPPDAAAEYLANRAAFYGVCIPAVAPLMSALGTGHDAKAFPFGQLTGLDNFAAARRVNSNGLFHKYILAGFDGGFKMHRTEIRRRGYAHDVDVGLEELLISICAVKAPFLWDFMPFAGPLSPAFEPVGCTNDFHLTTNVLARSQAVTQGSIATATAADQTDANFAGAGCKDTVRTHSHSGQGYHSRCLDEISTRDFTGLLVCFLLHK